MTKKELIAYNVAFLIVGVFWLIISVLDKQCLMGCLEGIVVGFILCNTINLV